MNLVTIIIPIYNMEKHLRRCLESVQQQTYTNIEVLLVDDGSIDNSASICQEFCLNDTRFRYLFQKNAGVSAARNYGLAVASGDLLGFCDSDDWIAPDYIEKLEQEFNWELCDLSIGGSCDVDQNGVITHIPMLTARRETIDSFTKNFWLYYDSEMLNTIGNKLFRRKLITHSFDVTMNCGEDLKFAMQYLENIRGVAVAETDGYYYYKPDTAVAKYQWNDAAQCMKFSESVGAFLASTKQYQDHSEKYLEFLCRNMCRDAGILAKVQPWKNAIRMINEFYRVPEFSQCLVSGVWKKCGTKYRVVGFMLNYRLVALLILISKLA